MCRLCGREACAECFEQVKDLTEDKPGATQAEIATLQARREKHAHTNPFFLSCTRRNEHHAKDFSPMSRFCKSELAQAIKDMEVLLVEPDPDEVPVVGAIDPALQNGHSASSSGTGAASNEVSVASSNSEIPVSSTLGEAAQVHPAGDPVNMGTQTQPPSNPLSTEPLEIPSHHTITISDSELTEDVFRPLWAKGDPLVVTGLLPKFRIQWTPEYFLQKYNSQSCLILECQSDVNKRVTVGEFFSWFGKYEGRVECWKLKVSSNQYRRLVTFSMSLRIGHHQLISKLHFPSSSRTLADLCRSPVTFVETALSISPHISRVIPLRQTSVRRDQGRVLNS
jgi:lysine-specific demethylase 3